MLDSYIKKGSLLVSSDLEQFLASEVLQDLDISENHFWDSLETIINKFKFDKDNEEAILICLLPIESTQSYTTTFVASFDYDYSINNALKDFNFHSLTSELKINNFITSFNFYEDQLFFL